MRSRDMLPIPPNLEPLKLVKYYSIMVDEVTDHYANMEILCICVRFVDVTNAKPCIKELFVDFLHLQRGTGEAVANGILTLWTSILQYG